MRFVIVVNCGPYQTFGSKSAYFFAKNVLASGHTIDMIFFYMDGALVANSKISPPNAEFDIYKKFSSIDNTLQKKIRKVVCVAAGMKRGIDSNLIGGQNDTFEIAGLGVLIQALNNCDRYITFA